MNRIVCEHPSEIPPGAWPPQRRGKALRVLCLSSQVLGLVRFGSAVEQGMALDEAFDAVHVRLRAPLWLRILGKSLPGLHGRDAHVLRHRELWTWRIRHWFARCVPIDRFDMIHVMNQHNAMSLLDARPGGWPRTVVAIDATAKAEMRDFGYGPWDRAILARGERRLFHRVDAVTCMSGWAADSVERDYGVDASRVIRSRIGLPPRHAPRDRESGAPDGPVRIVFIGNDWNRKGGDRLLRWHQSRWSDRVELHLVGRGSPEVKGVRSVIRHGEMSHGDLLDRLLPRMDLCVLPTWEDTLVFALLEAQACGIPVVSSRLAGIASDVVRDGETGLLCDRDDDAGFIHAVESLLGDAPRRIAMGQAARRWVMGAWSPEEGVRRYLRRLQEIADGPSDGA